MEKLKVHIRYVMLCEFKNNKNTTETAKNICSFYSHSVIIDSQVQN